MGPTAGTAGEHGSAPGMFAVGSGSLLPTQPARYYGANGEAMSSLHAAMHAMQQHAASKTVQSRVKRLDKKTKAYIEGTLRRAQHRSWCVVHGKTLPPPKLHPAIAKVIREWFDLVDDDGSGTLEHHELLAALQAAQIPCDASSISEMIRLMDANRDGCIGWSEFESFMMQEFVAGKHLLSGDYLLPSGMALPFGVMIRQLKRNQMLTEITGGGEVRRKWLHYDVNIAADAKAVADAEAAIALQKAYDETLHNRVTVELDESHSSQDSAPDSIRLGAAPAASSGHHQQQQQRQGAVYSGVRRPSWLPDADSSAAGVSAVVVAGIPVQQRQQPHSAGEDSSGRRSSDAAEAGGSSQGRLLTPRAWTKPDAVPRLSLGGLSSTTACPVSAGHNTSGSCRTHSSRRNSCKREQQGALRHDISTFKTGAAARPVLPGVEEGSVLASARTSYLTVSSAAAPTATEVGTAGSSNGSRLAQHLHNNTPRRQQQELLLDGNSSSSGGGLTLSLDAASLLSRLPASVQQLQLLGSPRLPSSSGGSERHDAAAPAPAAPPPRLRRPAKSAAAASALPEAASGEAGITWLTVAAAGASSSSSAYPAAPAAAGPGGCRCSSAGAVGGGSGSSPRHAAAGTVAAHHLLLPQPCREEWSTVAASCLSQRHSQQLAPQTAMMTPAGVRRWQQLPGTGLSSAAGAATVPPAAPSSSMADEVSLSGLLHQQQHCGGSFPSGCTCRLGSSSGGDGGVVGCTKPQVTRGRRASWSVCEGNSAAAAAAGADAAAHRGAQTHRCNGSSSGGSTASATAGAAAAAAANAAAAAALYGTSCREASMKYTSSARQLPPAALLSGNYIGPVAAAVAAAHTPRLASHSSCLLDQQQQPRSSAVSSAVAAQFNAAGAVGGPRSVLSDGSALLDTNLLVATNRGDAIVRQGQVLRYLADSGCSASSRAPFSNASSAAAPAAVAGSVGIASSSSNRAVPGVSPRHSITLHTQLQMAHKLQQPAGYRRTAAGSTCLSQQQLQRRAGSAVAAGDCVLYPLPPSHTDQQQSQGLQAANRSIGGGSWSGGGVCFRKAGGDHAPSPLPAADNLASSGSMSGRMRASGSSGCSAGAAAATAAADAAAAVGSSRSSSGGISATGYRSSSRKQSNNPVQRGSSSSGDGGKKVKHCAASGPLGGRHPAFINTYDPPAQKNVAAGAAGAASAVAVLNLEGCRSSFSGAGGAASSGGCCSGLMDADGFLMVAAAASVSEAGNACGGSSSFSGREGGSGTARAVSQSPRLAYSGISPRRGLH